MCGSPPGSAPLRPGAPERCVLVPAAGSAEAVQARIQAIVAVRLACMSAPDPRENPALLGHTSAEAEILSAMRGGRMHHAWLISGPAGVGKATLAYRFARRLLAGLRAGASLAMDPADPVFRRVATGSHADLLTIEREWDEKKRRMRGEIVVDDARAVSAFLRLTPAEGGWRVVVIDGAEYLNRNAANSVLKMLEEPPPRAVLLLVCAAPGRLLPTIRSRCRRLVLQPLDTAEMEAALADYLPDTPAAERTPPGGDRRRVARPGVAAGGRAGARLGRCRRRGAGRPPRHPPRCAPSRSPRSSGARGEDSFTPFMTLLCDGLGDIVRRAARGQPERLLQLRPLAEWADLWQSLTHILDETERLNLDRRQALLSSIAMLNGS